MLCNLKLVITYNLSGIKSQEENACRQSDDSRRGIIPPYISVRTLIQGLKDFPDFGQISENRIHNIASGSFR